jgi:hypothetical protein
MNVGDLAALDPATRARIDAACNFVNHKIAQLRRRVTIVTACAAVATVLVAAFTSIPLQFAAAGGIVVPMIVAVQARRELAKWYKTMVVQRVVEALGEGLTYTRESSLTKAQFHDLDLFRERADVWKSEDQVAGRRNDVDYALHEVRAARHEKRGKHTYEVVFFKGLIVALEFNKNFAGHTIVIPDREGKILGGLLGEAETRRRKQIVRLAHPEFERAYAVYSSDDQEAHYLLTPKLIELVLTARARLGNLRLAFHQNSLFVAVPSRHDRFEIGLTSKVSPQNVFSDLREVIALAEQLIEVLGLETRIWTRV